MGVYEDLGLETIINATGAATRLGGSPMPQAVLDAYNEAARSCVPLEQVQAAACTRIAAVTDTEAGIVTAGAAAALTLGAAAMITGYDLAKMELLPHCDDFACRFIVAREQRNGYDHAVRAAGARLVEVGFNEIVAGAGGRRTETWEFEAAIGPETVGILYVLTPQSRPDLTELVDMAHQHEIPVLVDAAGQLPPRENLKTITASGADLVAFSGGKSIRGPQSTGILCGRRDLIGPAALNMLDMDDHLELWSPPPELIDREKLSGIPRHGFGRGFKVSKEEIVALLTALDLFASGAYDEIVAGYRPRLESIAAKLTGLPAAWEILDNKSGETFPILEIKIDEAALGRTAWDVCRSLREGRPPIYPRHTKLFDATLIVGPLHLTDETAVIVAQRLREELGG